MKMSSPLKVGAVSRPGCRLDGQRTMCGRASLGPPVQLGGLVRTEDDAGVVQQRPPPPRRSATDRWGRSPGSGPRRAAARRAAAGRPAPPGPTARQGRDMISQDRQRGAAFPVTHRARRPAPAPPARTLPRKPTRAWARPGRERTAGRGKRIEYPLIDRLDLVQCCRDVGQQHLQVLSGSAPSPTRTPACCAQPTATTPSTSRSPAARPPTRPAGNRPGPAARAAPDDQRSPAAVADGEASTRSGRTAA